MDVSVFVVKFRASLRSIVIISCGSYVEHKAITNFRQQTLFLPFVSPLSKTDFALVVVLRLFPSRQLSVYTSFVFPVDSNQVPVKVCPIHFHFLISEVQLYSYSELKVSRHTAHIYVLLKPNIEICVFRPSLSTSQIEVRRGSQVDGSGCTV
jgi:hypothetical protein